MNPIIVSAAYDSTIIFWNSEGVFIDLMREEDGRNRKPVLAMSIVNEGTGLVAAYNGKLKLFDINKPRGESELRCNGVVENFNCMDYSDISRRLVTGSDDSMVRVWDAHRQTPNCTMEMRLSMDVLSVRLHPNQHTIFACDVNGAMCHMDIRNRSKTLISSPNLGLNEKMYAVAVSPNGKYLAAGTSQGRIFVWETHDFAAPVVVTKPANRRKFFKFNAAMAGCMAVARRAIEPSVSASWNSEPFVATVEKFVTNIRFKDNGTFVAMFCNGDIEVWSVHERDNKKPLLNLVDNRTRCLWAWDCAFTIVNNEDCALVCTGTDLRLWNMENGWVQRTFRGHAAPVTSFAYREAQVA
ncbi:hypothetical protein QR680_000582 [Steinernema hermaphroditum]|uniref:Target of rapamycin complex subunit lst8 n=1 Tax=Steinernema hermaphroditum TaxID=289476 RepID=A0AA39LEC5_9BILA|nr:hypothetical protein QR680_000582 [Steinernema hermaphroditum]